MKETEKDYTRIIATFEDLTDGKTYKREIGIDVSCIRFDSAKAEKVNEVIEYWIVERGNPQHSTNTHKANLSLIGWNFYTKLEARKIYC